jgi:hypothetical protein
LGANPKAKNQKTHLKSIRYGGESVSQSSLKDKAFSTFLGQNPPFERLSYGRKWDFAASKTLFSHGPIVESNGIKRLAKGELPSRRPTGPCCPPVCTENLDPGVVMMKPAEYRVRTDDSNALNRARDRRILIQ